MKSWRRLLIVEVKLAWCLTARIRSFEEDLTVVNQSLLVVQKGAGHLVEEAGWVALGEAVGRTALAAAAVAVRTGFAAAAEVVACTD